MTNPFEKIGHELDKYFGLGPLFGLADDDDEKRKKAAGTNRGSGPKRGPPIITGLALTRWQKPAIERG